jgi:predicted NodU family carbamoyl transferase
LKGDRYAKEWLVPGRMEFGLRALGNRSILGDPRRPTMQKTLTLKVKYRESFRRFATSVRLECRRPVYADGCTGAARAHMEPEEQALFGMG